MQQISFFEGKEKFTFSKPIRLITLFSGYDSQALALKYLGVPFEHFHTCEWAIPSIQALKDLHFSYDNGDYSIGLSKADLVKILAHKGVSSNYNEPMTEEQLSRYGETKLRTIFNNIIATRNLVSICNIHGKDLEISETDKYEYIMTYSFPCQDLSVAGARKGMERGSGTRSGLLWEVERLLKETPELPQVLIMENVKQVIGQKNISAFADWVAFLDELGYKSKWKVINASEFGIPQNRERCFMVSVLGDKFYDFPQTTELNVTLGDFLEPKERVDNRYYLSDAIVEYYIRHTEESKVKGNGFKFEPTTGGGIAKAVTTRAGGRMDDNFISYGVLLGKSPDFQRGGLRNLSRTIDCNGKNGVVLYGREQSDD